MKINAQITSILSFHGKVQAIKNEQYKKILKAMKPGRNYTGQQLYKLTGYTPNIISARLFELREDLKLIVRSEERIICRLSKHPAFTHRRAA